MLSVTFSLQQAGTCILWGALLSVMAGCDGAAARQRVRDQFAAEQAREAARDSALRAEGLTGQMSMNDVVAPLPAIDPFEECAKQLRLRDSRVMEVPRVKDNSGASPGRTEHYFAWNRGTQLLRLSDGTMATASCIVERVEGTIALILNGQDIGTHTMARPVPPR
jgi:hypothetical protein